MPDTVSYEDRVRGCLLGGALGDALGAPIEFWSLEQITRAAPNGVRDFIPVAYGRARGTGLITDDTQMTLFTVEGLIRAQVRQISKGISSPPAVIHHAYLRWLTTQERDGPPNPVGDGRGRGEDEIDGWLGQQQWLYSQRAPGVTCLTALKASRELGAFGYEARNDSKGCGGVMRSAPFGLAPLNEPGQVAMECAAITHGHPTGQVASGALAVLIAAIVRGADLETALDATEDWLAATPDSEETNQAFRHARILATAPASSPRDCLPLLGEGWIAEESLAIGVFAAQSYPEPEQFVDAVSLAVMHTGDSDSTGSICGNILGALHGHDVLPVALLDQLEGRPAISDLADDLATISTGASEVFEPMEQRPGVLQLPEVSERWSERYPGW